VKNSSIRLVIIIATILLVGIVSVQLIWIQRAYQLQVTQLNYDITQALIQVSRAIQNHQGDETLLLDPVKQVEDQTFIVKTNENPDPDYIEALLTQEFKKQEINLDFEYNLYNCFNDSVIFTKAVKIDQGKAVEKENPSTVVNWRSDDGHYFSVYFSNKTKMVIDRLNFWIFSSFLLLVLAAFFAYTINIILKQKRLGDTKNDFINNMTHELKTPISTISLSTNVLLKPGIENQPERIRNYAEIIKKENERLQLQVEKVLQIASLDKDKVEMQFETCNLFELVSDSVSTFKTIIEENSGTITSNIANKNIEVKLDKIHIYNVLSNLIDNAIKYCDTNPEIEIAVYEKGNNIEIHVQDNGIGMKPSEVKYIFDKFYRVPTGNLHNVKGFGLGLYYAKVIMQAHNGSISVEKNEPIGSAFILKIPRSK